MRSAAHFRGHPIYLMLIPFFFVFLTGAFLFDLVGRTTGNAGWWSTGRYFAIAGIIMALLAVVSGLVDYFRTVPPKSIGKRRAMVHMLLNLSVVGLFIVAIWLRSGSVGSELPVLVLEGIAVAMLFIVGWQGGVLVSRNQISVDYCYARAGRWKEANVKGEVGQSVIVVVSGELEVDQMKFLRVNDCRLVLARIGEGYVVFDDGCIYRGGSLAGGVMIRGVVQCPWHGSQFDCRKGVVVVGSAKESIGIYSVSERDGKIVLILGM